MRVIRKLTGILVDNAVKYADEGGEMRPKSGNRRQILHKFNKRRKYGKDIHEQRTVLAEL